MIFHSEKAFRSSIWKALEAVLSFPLNSQHRLLATVTHTQEPSPEGGPDTNLLSRAHPALSKSHCALWTTALQLRPGRLCPVHGTTALLGQGQQQPRTVLTGSLPSLSPFPVSKAPCSQQDRIWGSNPGTRGTYQQERLVRRQGSQDICAISNMAKSGNSNRAGLPSLPANVNSGQQLPAWSMNHFNWMLCTQQLENTSHKKNIWWWPWKLVYPFCTVLLLYFFHNWPLER